MIRRNLHRSLLSLVLIACGNITFVVRPMAGEAVKNVALAFNAPLRTGSLQPNNCARGDVDGDGGFDTGCGAVLAPTPAALSLPTAEDLSPKIFHASQEAQAGDIISIQGANFDASTIAILDETGGVTRELSIVERVGTIQVSVQLPSVLVDPVMIRLKSKDGTSATFRLNAARPLHIDATRLVAGGKFRLYGRNLKRAGYRPGLIVDGVPALVDLSTSTDTVLTATLPQTVKPTPRAAIAVDNGNGSGPTPLEEPVAVDAGSGSDPLGLGIGWAGGFDFVNHVVRAAAACNGTTDDTESIRAGIRQATQEGGGVVLLPAGTCLTTGTVDLASRVILRGAGQNRTVLLYGANYPVFAEKLDLVGLQDLELRNAGNVQEGMRWDANTRSVIQRVTLNMLKSRQWFLTDNTDFVFDSNTIRQTASYDEQNPYRFDRSSGLVFSNNISINTSGSPTFQRVHDSVFVGNRFVRDASTQDESPVIAHHQFVVDFAYRISVIGNRFEVLNGPVTNKLRNDGETILVEGGGPLHTDQIGTVAKASSNTLSDPSTTVNVDPFQTGMPWNMGVAIVAGKGMGQARRVIAYKDNTLVVAHDWDVIPDGQSRYATFVWGLADVLIANNTLTDNPRGIWLYQTSVRDVIIANNTIRNGGGIYLRSFQSQSQHLFNIQLDVLAEGNAIASTTGAWMPYVIVANVRSDPSSLGTGEIGIAIRRNQITANVPNLTTNTEEYASHEGFAALVHVENDNKQLTGLPAMLGVIMQSNVCDRCESAYLTGTGSVGAVFADNKPGIGNSAGFSDLLVWGNGFGGSTGTFKR